MTTTRVTSCPICNDNHLIHSLSYTDNISNETFEILQCSNCGLQITQQAPLLSDMMRFYPDKEASCYKEPQNWLEKLIKSLNNRWNKEQVHIVCKEADRASGVILEIGCKQGYFANTIRADGWLTHALEHDNTAREYANNRFSLQAESTDVMFNIKPRSYNVVIAWDTLGECVDLHRTLECLSQLIVSDGTLIIAFHDAKSSEAKSYGNRWMGWNTPRKRWHLTHKAFEQLSAQHNLSIVNRRSSSLRSTLTTWESEIAQNTNKKTLFTLLNCAIKNKVQKENTYYIYTLKHQ